MHHVLMERERLDAVQQNFHKKMISWEENRFEMSEKKVSYKKDFFGNIEKYLGDLRVARV